MFDVLFEDFKHFNVAVIGDVMLDTYWWGKTDRISPEAPVPVVSLKDREYRIGGAGNVALNLVALGARVCIHSVIGKDEDGILLEQLLQKTGIDTSGISKSKQRLTTNKIRIISRNQHLLRVDQEITFDLSEPEEQLFIQRTFQHFKNDPPDVVIFEDYNKGVLTDHIIKTIMDYCQRHQIITAVDPKRKNFFSYTGATLFKPNLKEVREALNVVDTSASLSNLKTIHSLLHEQLRHSISLITLSELGVFYAQNGHEAAIIPAFVRNIADVSGAGDTVIAVASLVFAATKNINLMAMVANLAGGLVCEEVGTASIDVHRLLQECQRLLTNQLDANEAREGLW